jgi:hypothetical protein
MPASNLPIQFNQPSNTAAIRSSLRNTAISHSSSDTRILPKLTKFVLSFGTLAIVFKDVTALSDANIDASTTAIGSCIARKEFSAQEHLINPNMRWTKDCDKTIAIHRFKDEATNEFVHCELKSCYHAPLSSDDASKIKDPREQIDNWGLQALYIYRKDACGKAVVNQVDSGKISGLDLPMWHDKTNPPVYPDAQQVEKNCQIYFKYLQNQENNLMHKHCADKGSACPIYETDSALLKMQADADSKKNQKQYLAKKLFLIGL